MTQDNKQEEKDLFMVADPGTQRSRSSTFGTFFDSVDNYLDLYLELYNNVPVLEGAVNAYQNFINPGWHITTPDNDLNTVAVTEEVLKILNFNEVLNDQIIQMLLYGFSGSEMVFTEDYSQILRIVPISSRQLRLKRDIYGTIVSYHQLGGWINNQQTNQDPFTSEPTTGYNKNNDYRLGGSRTTSIQSAVLDPESILFFNRKVSESNLYGRSLFRSLPTVTRQMLSINDAVVKIYSKYGSPRFHVKYVPANELSEAKLRTRLNTLKDRFSDLEHGEDFFTAGDIEVSVIGPGSSGASMTMETSYIMMELFSGLGLPAGVLGFNYGSTETHMKEQVQVLLGHIQALQTEVSAYINRQLMPKIAMIYGLKEVPELVFYRPRIRDRHSEAVAEATEISNVVTLLENKLITPDTALTRLDFLRKQ
ncbi:MAG: hypothetical protein KAU20_06505 [Nanoarchaeota archaeon]|nr:hypothetical protein [Nanoarchaeota archaeon]